jgi:hypothetical protein
MISRTRHDILTLSMKVGCLVISQWGYLRWSSLILAK